MSWEADLLGGLATWCQQQGLGTYRPDAVGGTIVLGSLPDEIDQGIGVRGYNQQPDPALSDVVQPIQFLLRGDEAWCRDTAGALFDGLHGVTGMVPGGIDCPLITQHSDVPLGPDQRGRYERAVNYDVWATRPTASRTD